MNDVIGTRTPNVMYDYTINADGCQAEYASGGKKKHKKHLTDKRQSAIIIVGGESCIYIGKAVARP